VTRLSYCAWATVFLLAPSMAAAMITAPRDHLFGDTTDYCATYHSDGRTWTDCRYQAQFDALSDMLRTEAGRLMMTGPWATEEDIDFPAVTALVGDRPIAMNLHLRGMGIVIPRDASAGLINHVTIEGGEPHAAIEVQSPPSDPYARWRPFAIAIVITPPLLAMAMLIGRRIVRHR
jgi:hypothetical protein